MSKKKNKNEQNPINNKGQKWCENHKSRTHDTANCRGIKKADSNLSDNQTYILKEPKIAPKLIEMEAKLNDKEVAIIFDTWATHNYVNEKIVQRLNIPTNNIETPVETEMADGSKIKVKQTAQIQFYLQGSFSYRYIYSV